jgi:iron(III) transport system ATP-binding protein
MNSVEVQRLSKRYPWAASAAVREVTFSLQEGQILALVGPSGCGKTTTLRLIAGLERPDEGLIRLNGQVVSGEGVFVPPERRGVGMVFQDHALFPHLTVFENVAFGLRGRKRGEIRAAVGELLSMVGLEAMAGRYPHALSGGERQRAALARALAPGPVLLLMDEPFSSLDADLRREVRQQVRGILKRLQATVVFVTHDQEEALYMGDLLGVLQQGGLAQIGAPEQVFHAPRQRFVAEFMGASDFLSGQVQGQGISTEIGRLAQAAPASPSGRVAVAVRADDVDFEPAEPGNAVIVERLFLGAFNLYRLRLDSGQTLHAYKSHTEIVAPGSRVRAFISAGHPLAVFEQGQAGGGGGRATTGRPYSLAPGGEGWGEGVAPATMHGPSFTFHEQDHE